MRFLFDDLHVVEHQVVLWSEFHLVVVKALVLLSRGGGAIMTTVHLFALKTFQRGPGLTALWNWGWCLW